MCEVTEDSLKACLCLLELFAIRGDEMEERGRGLQQDGQNAAFREHLSGSGAIYSPARFLSTYYVTPTVISFKVKIMNKAEALWEVGGSN